MATATQRPPSVFNLPNQLTAARLGLAIVLFALIDLGNQWHWCVLVFAAAAFTDWLDGYLARRQGLFTAVGRVFDPLVDKVLVCGAFIYLLATGGTGLAPWMVTVVVARELIITGMRSFLENKGVVFGADWLGKIKMGLQCAALLGIFIVLYLEERHYPDGLTDACRLARNVLIYGMVTATALSGLQYVGRAAVILREDKTL